MPKGEFDDAINEALDAQEMLERKAAAFDRIIAATEGPFVERLRPIYEIIDEVKLLTSKL